MTTKQIADRLVAHCRSAKWETAQRELYAENAVSLEPHDTPLSPRETRGLKAIIEKGKRFDAMVEQMHSIDVSEPVVANQAFACSMHLDITMKGEGRMQMSELCVYQVNDGKIVSEQFFV